MTWEELLKISYGVSFSELGWFIPLIPDDYIFHKIDDNQYVFGYPEEGTHQIIYCGFFWTASEAVAIKLFNLEMKPLTIHPELLPAPNILFPEPTVNHYQQLVEFGKHSDPEYFFESAGRFWTVHFDDFVFYFKKAYPNDNEQPIAIEVDLRPWKRSRAG